MSKPSFKVSRFQISRLTLKTETVDLDVVSLRLRESLFYSAAAPLTISMISLVIAA
jgi:hypothetical protein